MDRYLGTLREMNQQFGYLRSLSLPNEEMLEAHVQNH